MTPVKTIDLASIQAAWKSVFISNEPFIWPFQNAIKTGHLFYPTDGYHLTEIQYLAIMKAIKDIGDSDYFLSITESEGLSFLDRKWGHWLCNSPSYAEYNSINLTLENALYSKTGDWGILISHEMHALIGGTNEFMNALEGYYQNWVNDFYELREAWANNSNSWLKPIANRIRTSGAKIF